VFLLKNFRSVFCEKNKNCFFAQTRQRIIDNYVLHFACEEFALGQPGHTPTFTPHSSFHPLEVGHLILCGQASFFFTLHTPTSSFFGPTDILPLNFYQDILVVFVALKNCKTFLKVLP